jgi:hypothetical protein
MDHSDKLQIKQKHKCIQTLAMIFLRAVAGFWTSDTANNQTVVEKTYV